MPSTGRLRIILGQMEEALFGVIRIGDCKACEQLLDYGVSIEARDEVSGNNITSIL
jgi:hypothetical protein